MWADSGYRGAQARVMRDVQWHIAGRPSDMAKVEHPFRVIKRQFGLVNVRFKGPAKNTTHVITLFALSNLWMARRKLIAMMEQMRPQTV